MNRFDEWLGRPVSMRALALVRIFAGPITIVSLSPFLADARDGFIYRDAFFEPYAAWYPELPRDAYVGVLWLGMLAAVAMSLGIATRVATATTFAVVTYNLFLSTTHFHNNRAYLVIVLGILAVAPSGRELSLDAWIRRRRGLEPCSLLAPAWPLLLARFEVSVVYGASALSKLVDPDWFGGTVTWRRTVHRRADLMAAPIPDWLVDVLTDRSFHVVLAKVIVLTELFLAFGLWWRFTRDVAVWTAVCFHAAIEATSSVQVFSYLAIVMLLVWSAPSTRDRALVVDLSTSSGRRLAATVRALDWLARFRLVTGSGETYVIDRDGTLRSGRSAVVLVLSRLPLTAWFALPALILVRPHRLGPLAQPSAVREVAG